MSEKILLVDDEPHVLFALVRSLGRRFTLQCAGSGAEALALIKQDGPFAVIVSDMRMPGMHGLDLLRQVRGRSPETVRLVLSGAGDFGMVVSAINDGAVFRFLTKPVTTDALRDALESALVRHRCERRVGAPMDPDETLLREMDELRGALRKGEMRLYAQPQYDFTQRRVTGVEMLIRWNHPARGILTPDKFLPLVGIAGLQGTLTAWVLDEACRIARRWDDGGLPPISVAVNVTASDLTQADLAVTVQRCLEAHGLPGPRLELELVEDALLGDLGQTMATLCDIGGLGVTFSIDDFGTGHSSLSRLRQLPMTKLKIDRSFVGDVAEDPDAYGVIKMIVGLGHGLGMSVLAEGIETAPQMAAMRDVSCDSMQGYHLARPMPAEDFPAWMVRADKTLGPQQEG